MTATRRHLIFLPVLLALLSAPCLCEWWEWEDRSPAEAVDLMKVLHVAPGATVAEIGAGGGELARAMALLLGPDSRLYATELLDDYMKMMTERLTPEEFPQITIVRGAETTTNLPAGSCDAVYLRRVFHHVSRPVEMSAAIFELLRPGGRLAVVDFRLGGIRAATHGISPEVIEKHLADAGFKLEQTSESWREGDYIVVASKPVASDPEP